MSKKPRTNTADIQPPNNTPRPLPHTPTIHIKQSDAPSEEAGGLGHGPEQVEGLGGRAGVGARAREAQHQGGGAGDLFKIWGRGGGWSVRGLGSLADVRRRFTMENKPKTHLEPRALGAGGGDEVEQRRQVREAVQALCIYGWSRKMNTYGGAEGHAHTHPPQHDDTPTLQRRCFSRRAWRWYR